MVSRTVFSLFFCIFVILHSDRVDARSTKIDFDIEAMPLYRAMQLFAAQARVSVSVAPSLKTYDKSVTLKGWYTARKALDHLLAHTDYAAVFVTPIAVKVASKHSLTDNSEPDLASENLAPIEEVHVTALRRREPLFRLPYAIGVLEPGRDLGVVLPTTQEIAGLMSGFHASPQYDGRSKLVVRGLADGAFNGRAQSLVSSYIDFTRLVYSAPDPGLALLDVERVELMRGPQGALYGSGAMGGTYRIVTRKPDKRAFQASIISDVSIVQDGGPEYGFSSVLNIPFSGERGALRASGFWREKGGFIDDSRLGRENVNAGATVGGRVAVTYQLNEHLDVTAVFSGHRSHADDTGYYLKSKGPYLRENYLQEPSADRLSLPSLRLDGDFDWGNLVSTVYVLDRHLRETLDASMATPAITGRFVPASPFKNSRNIKAYASETHIASKPGVATPWLIGAFFSVRKERMNSSLTTPGFGPSGLYGPRHAVYYEMLETRLVESAIFGEATFPLGAAVELTIGGRMFLNQNKASSLYSGASFAATISRSTKRQQAGISPKLVLSFTPHDRLTLYAQTTTGYRLGGYNMLGPVAGDTVYLSKNWKEEDIIFATDNTGAEAFASDTLVNYELGLKYTSPTGLIAVNMALFAADWRNIQTLQYDGLGSPTIGNVGDAIVYGGEADLTLRWSEKGEVRANMSWTGSRLNKALGAFGAEEGTSLPGVPKVMGGIKASKHLMLSNMPMEFAIQYSFRGAMDMVFGNDVIRTDLVHLVGVRLAMPIGDGVIELYADNIFATNANQFSLSNPFNVLQLEDGSLSTDQVLPASARRFGVGVRWDW